MSRMLIAGLLCLSLMACSSEDAAERAADEDKAARLVEQASELIQEREYQAAVAPMTDAIALAPANTEYQLLRCFLLERTGTALAETKRCYTDVVDLFSKAPDRPCNQDMNCVIASLMAESDQAEATRTAFLEEPASQAELEVRRYVLEGFNRQAYLNTLFP